MRRLAPICLILLLLVVAGAGATGNLLPTSSHHTPTAPPFAETSLKVALNDSLSQRRLLLVFIAGNKAREKDHDALFENPALAAWVRRHAIAIKVTDKDTIKLLADAGLTQTSSAEPMLFKDAKQLRLFGGVVPSGATRLKAPPNAGPMYPGLLLKLDWTLRATKKSDPGFFTSHDVRVVRIPGAPPANSPPAASLLSARDDAAGSPVQDSTHPAVVLHRLDQARDAARSKDFRAAGGLYTWLWERGGAVDPAFDPVRLTIAAREIAELCALRPELRARFSELRVRTLAALNWTDDARVFEYFALCRIVADSEETLAFIDAALNDPDSIDLMPRADKLILETMLPRAHFEPTPQNANPYAAVRRLASLLAEKKSEKSPMDDADYQRVQTFRAFLLRLEACRAYAGLLAQARPEDATAAARELLAAIDTADSRLALITAALAHGQSSPALAKWLDESAHLGSPRDDLRSRLSPKP